MHEWVPALSMPGAPLVTESQVVVPRSGVAGWGTAAGALDGTGGKTKIAVALQGFFEGGHQRHPLARANPDLRSTPTCSITEICKIQLIKALRADVSAMLWSAQQYVATRIAFKRLGTHVRAFHMLAALHAHGMRGRTQPDLGQDMSVHEGDRTICSAALGVQVIDGVGGPMALILLVAEILDADVQTLTMLQLPLLPHSTSRVHFGP
eukprot:2359707-Amphidinium_carterae.1